MFQLGQFVVFGMKLLKPNACHKGSREANSMVTIKHWSKTDAGGMGAGSHAGGSFAGKKLLQGGFTAQEAKAICTAKNAILGLYPGAEVKAGQGKEGPELHLKVKVGMVYIGYKENEAEKVEKGVSGELGKKGIAATVAVSPLYPELQGGLGVCHSICRITLE